MPKKLTAAQPPCNLRHANAAGRILAVLERIKESPKGNAVGLWSRGLNCNGDISDVYAGLAVLKQQYLEVLEYCETEKGPQHRWTASLPKVLVAIQPNSLSEGIEHQKNMISDEVLLLLDTIAEQMPQESLISNDDFAELNRMLDELWAFVRDSQDFKGQLRRWLMELIRMMKDGLCRYDIKGARGLRADFLIMTAELALVFESVSRGEQPDVTPAAADDLRTRVVQFVMKLKSTLDSAVKYVPLLRWVADSALTDGVSGHPQLPSPLDSKVP